jgi:hypothetical protein
MGSGGTRALWPANPAIHVNFPSLTFRFWLAGNARLFGQWWGRSDLNTQPLGISNHAPELSHPPKGQHTQSCFWSPTSYLIRLRPQPTFYINQPIFIHSDTPTQKINRCQSKRCSLACALRRVKAKRYAT